MAVSSASGSFSPVTLFECTLSNASMLVDSMEEKDLVIALRITNQLHSKIVDVLDPKLSSLVDRVNAATVVPQYCFPVSDISNEADSQERQPKRIRYDHNINDGHILKHENGSDAFETKVKLEDYGDSDDDVILLEPDDGFGQAAIDAVNSGRAVQHLPNFNVSSLNSSFSNTSSISGAHSTRGGFRNNASINSSSDGAGDVRSYMRQAYKNLKSSGPHLFDFSQPFTSSVNQEVAQRVVAEAQRMVSGNPWGEDVWRIIKDIYRLSSFNAGCKKRGYNRKQLKLSRRQRSFEAIFATLDPETADHFRVVLSRDFTSSDEEIEEENGAVDGNLRVRVLPWESARVREMKARLDEVYLTQYASEKQRNQIRRTVRDPTVYSTRSCPEGVPDWAVQNLSLG